MSRNRSLLVAAVAVLLLVLLSVSAAAKTPRCAEDGATLHGATVPTVFNSSLSYDGVSGCANGGVATFDVVKITGFSSAVAKLNKWSYMVAVRSGDMSTYLFAAKCDGVTVCLAEVNFLGAS